MSIETLILVTIVAAVSFAFGIFYAVQFAEERAEHRHALLFSSVMEHVGEFMNPDTRDEFYRASQEYIKKHYREEDMYE